MNDCFSAQQQSQQPLPLPQQYQKRALLLAAMAWFLDFLQKRPALFLGKKGHCFLEKTLFHSFLEQALFLERALFLGKEDCRCGIVSLKGQCSKIESNLDSRF